MIIFQKRQEIQVSLNVTLTCSLTCFCEWQTPHHELHMVLFYMPHLHEPTQSCRSPRRQTLLFSVPFYPRGRCNHIRALRTVHRGGPVSTCTPPPHTSHVLGTVPGSGDKMLSKVSSALEKLRVQWESRKLRDGQPPDLISREAVGLGPTCTSPQFQYLHRAWPKDLWSKMERKVSLIYTTMACFHLIQWTWNEFRGSWPAVLKHEIENSVPYIIIYIFHKAFISVTKVLMCVLTSSDGNMSISHTVSSILKLWK